MCNRVRRTYTLHQVIDLFEKPFAPRKINFDALRESNSAFEPRFNVAPNTTCPVLREVDGELRFDLMHWNLTPLKDWWTTPRKPLMTNAVIEKLKTTWAANFKHRRCLIPVNGFWEWSGPKGDKQGWAIEHCDGTPLVMAGLWDVGRHEGVERDSFAIITMPASPWMSAIHDRQPAMLPTSAWADYLAAAPADLAAMTEPVNEQTFRAFKVGKHVNKVGNEGPECLIPIAA